MTAGGKPDYTNLLRIYFPLTSMVSGQAHCSLSIH